MKSIKFTRNYKLSVWGIIWCHISNTESFDMLCDKNPRKTPNIFHETITATIRKLTAYKEINTTFGSKTRRLTVEILRIPPFSGKK